MTTATTLPRWDMTVVYPQLASSEFEQGFAAVVRHIDDLGALFDHHHIDGSTPPATLDTATLDTATLDTATLDTFTAILTHYNQTIEATRTLSAYISAFVTTNTRDDLAQGKSSELQRHTVKLAQLGVRLTAWLGALDIETLIAHSPLAADHAYTLRQAKVRATHLLTPAEENLAAELNVTGGSAWSKLHGNLTSQLTVTIQRDSHPHQIPMSEARNLAYDPDRAIRRSAYQAELAAWDTAAIPLAAAINSIKGQVNTLSTRRGWPTPLDEAIFDANIDRPTLDAMFEAAHAAFPDLRRYLRAKARALHLDRLAWYDLFAPIGASAHAWQYDEATAFILEQFGSYSPDLRAYAARAFQENWIDAEPRSGKQDGAYCMWLRRDESRVFANYKAAFGGMSTLAHELGHGYHNMRLASRTMLQRSTPMTLAETASIFCETIVRHAALARADQHEQLLILEASLQGDCQIVVDITSRFLFEQRVFERRRQRELSTDELDTLMLQAQRETYGDGLDDQQLHPRMWAVKSHYYSASRSFYNFPYMFGLLFGLGLYAQYQQDPTTFRRGYDDLLASTGLADAATLAARFGIDTRATSFWQSSLAIIRADVDRFEQLVAALQP